MDSDFGHGVELRSTSDSRNELSSWWDVGPSAAVDPKSSAGIRQQRRAPAPGDSFRGERRRLNSRGDPPALADIRGKALITLGTKAVGPAGSPTCYFRRILDAAFTATARDLSVRRMPYLSLDAIASGPPGQGLQRAACAR
jgi:hypothetical protein